MLIAFAANLYRIIITVIFAWSFMSKIRNVRSFQTTIAGFKLFPHWISHRLAYVFLTGELMVVGMMSIGDGFLSWGYLLASLLLITFSIALAYVLYRNIDTPCHCFGPSEDHVSLYDIIRNIGLILIAVAGLDTLPVSHDGLNLVEYALVGIVAIVFVFIWINLKPVVVLLLDNFDS